LERGKREGGRGEVEREGVREPERVRVRERRESESERAARE
jgi:hypothetical protein